MQLEMKCPSAPSSLFLLYPLWWCAEITSISIILVLYISTSISISVAAEVRAQLIPVTTCKLWYVPQLLMVWGSVGFVPILAAVGVWWWSRTREWSWSKRMWMCGGLTGSNRLPVCLRAGAVQCVKLSIASCLCTQESHSARGLWTWEISRLC